jgi:aspartate oxidase
MAYVCFGALCVTCAVPQTILHSSKRTAANKASIVVIKGRHAHKKLQTRKFPKIASGPLEHGITPNDQKAPTPPSLSLPTQL